jgi:23S rRNA U2552 (ribose-2'-O)-methylase RlmE/FtsJ
MNTPFVEGDMPKIMMSYGDAPGGFDQALARYRKFKFLKVYQQDKIYGIPATPGGHLSSNAKGFKDAFGKAYCTLNYSNNITDYFKFFPEDAKADIVTCDGSVPLDPTRLNGRSREYVKPFFEQILLTLNVQKKGGNCCIRVLGLETMASAQLLYLLYLHYDQLAIIKPITTRVQSNERYVVGYGFRGIKTEKHLDEALELYAKLSKERSYVDQLLESKFVPDSFYKMIKESRKLVLNFQQPLLKKAMELGEAKNNKVFEDLRKRVCGNLLYSVDWCVKNEVHLKKEYFLLRAPSRLPFLDSHACSKIYPIKANKKLKGGGKLTLHDHFLALPLNRRKSLLKETVENRGKTRTLEYLKILKNVYKDNKELSRMFQDNINYVSKLSSARKIQLKKKP